METRSVYTTKLIEILQEYATSQDEALNTAATKCADTLEAGGLVHLFGSGHSVLPIQEAFPRYGSFVGLYPLTDSRLMWHGIHISGGSRELLWLERTEGYVSHFLDHEPLNPGDVIVVYSHSGLNAAGIEVAQYAKERGMYVIAVTSKANLYRKTPHSSGKSLSEVADVTIDTLSPVEDAIVSIDGWGRPVGGSSTAIAMVTSHELITRTAAILAERGITLPTFVSPTVEGATVASNDEVFDEHEKRVQIARQKRIDAMKA